jgi:hypothetical protein
LEISRLRIDWEGWKKIGVLAIVNIFFLVSIVFVPIVFLLLVISKGFEHVVYRVYELLAPFLFFPGILLSNVLFDRRRFVLLAFLPVSLDALVLALWWLIDRHSISFLLVTSLFK